MLLRLYITRDITKQKRESYKLHIEETADDNERVVQCENGMNRDMFKMIIIDYICAKGLPLYRVATRYSTCPCI